MDKKKILIGVSIVLIIASIGVSIFLIFNKPEDNEFTIDGITLPNNREILKNKTIGSLEITDVSLLTRNEISTFKARLSNNTGKDIYIKELSVIFYDDDDEIEASLLKDASIGSSNYVYVSVDSEIDLSNISKIEYVLE